MKAECILCGKKFDNMPDALEHAYFDHPEIPVMEREALII